MLTTEQILAKYGQPGDPDNLKVIQLPYPMVIAWDKKITVTRIQCHKLIANALISALTEVLSVYGIDKIKELGLDIFGGCYNFRLMRGSKTTWSRHSWGIAIDLDPERNALKTKWKDSQFAKPEYADFLKIFEKFGFKSYGLTKGFDSMHFEISS